MKKMTIATLATLTLAIPFASFYVSNASAANISVAPAGSKLRYQETADQYQPSAANESFIAELALKLQEKDYLYVPGKNQEGTHVMTLDRANAIFTTADLSRMAMLKIGVKLSDEKYNGKLLSTKSGVWSYNATTKTGVSYALIFAGFTQQQALDAINTAVVASEAPIRSQREVASILGYLIPSAHAACPTPPNTVSAETVAAMAAKVGQSAASSPEQKAVEMALGCGASAITGALLGTTVGTGAVAVGMAAAGGVAVVEGAKHLYNSGALSKAPKSAVDGIQSGASSIASGIKSAYTAGFSGTVEKVTASTKKNWQAAKDLFAEMKSQASKYAREGFDKMIKHPEIVAEFACSVYGSLPSFFLRKALEAGFEKAGANAAFKAAFDKVIAGSSKFASYFKRGEKAAAVATAEVAGAKTAVAVEKASAKTSSAESKASSARTARATQLEESNSARETASSVSKAEKPAAKVVAQSDAKPVAAKSATREAAAVETAPAAAATDAAFVEALEKSPVVATLKEAGVTDTKPVLEALSDVAHNPVMAEDKEITVVAALNHAAPAQVAKVEAEVAKIAERAPASASGAHAADLHRNFGTIRRDLEATNGVKALEKNEFLKNPKDVAEVEVTVREARDHGYTTAQIEDAAEDAVSACKPGK